MKRALPPCIALFLIIIAVPVLAASEREDRTEGGNTYATGGNVIVSAPVNADLMAAGGHVDVESEVAADAALAGGAVNVRSPVKQDLRVAGGTVNINQDVGGELLAAGGTVRLAPSATVAGSARMAGSDVVVAGRIGKSARIYGNDITVSGRIGGDAHLYGQNIFLSPDARIDGNLYYASPTPLPEDAAARVGGSITREEAPSGWSQHRGFSVLVFFHPIFVVSMLVAGMLLFLLFPNAVTGTGNAIKQYPVRSLLLGLALLFAVPPAAIFFMMTVIGIPIGFTLILLYPLMLLLGYLGAAFFIGRRTADAMKQPEALSAGRQALFLALALIILSVAALIPFLGGIIVVLALVLGVGGWAVWMQTRHAARRAV